MECADSWRKMLCVQQHQRVMFQIFLKIHLNAHIVQLSFNFRSIIFQFPIVESTEDVFKVQKVRQDLIDPEAFEEIKNGKWSCKRLRELILHMVLPQTAFKGKQYQDQVEFIQMECTV
jgi:hypothetical protein